MKRMLVLCMALVMLMVPVLSVAEGATETAAHLQIGLRLTDLPEDADQTMTLASQILEYVALDGGMQVNSDGIMQYVLQVLVNGSSAALAEATLSGDDLVVYSNLLGESAVALNQAEAETLLGEVGTDVFGYLEKIFKPASIVSSVQIDDAMMENLSNGKTVEVIGTILNNLQPMEEFTQPEGADPAGIGLSFVMEPADFMNLISAVKEDVTANWDSISKIEGLGGVTQEKVTEALDKMIADVEKNATRMTVEVYLDEDNSSPVALLYRVDVKEEDEQEYDDDPKAVGSLLRKTEDTELLYYGSSLVDADDDVEFDYQVSVGSDSVEVTLDGYKVDDGKQEDPVHLALTVTPTEDQKMAITLDASTPEAGFSCESLAYSDDVGMHLDNVLSVTSMPMKLGLNILFYQGEVLEPLTSEGAVRIAEMDQEALGEWVNSISQNAMMALMGALQLLPEDVLSNVMPLLTGGQ